MGSSSELGPGCSPFNPWNTLHWLSPGPKATFWGLWVGEGREGSHHHRNGGFLVCQSPHPALRSPGCEGALTYPGLLNELAASSLRAEQLSWGCHMHIKP